MGRLSLLGRPGRPKVVPIKIFTVSRDRFSLPDRNFSIQAITVVPVFSVFLDRPRSSLWCFHIIVPVAWPQFEKTGATGTTLAIIWKPGLKVTLGPPTHTKHDFSESLVSPSLTERASTSEEWSLECQVLKIDKHVIQNRTMRQQKSWTNSRSKLFFFLILLIRGLSSLRE